MATSQYSYHPYHTIGAATLLLWDGAAGGGAGAWRQLGKVADAAVLMTTEQVGKELTIKGLTQPVARRNRAKRYSVTFRMLEDANPLTLDLLYSEGAMQSAGASELVATSEVLRLYATDYTELAHPYGIRSTPPAGVSGVSASAGGSGGSIPPGTYYYWIVAYFDFGGGLGLESAPAISGAVNVSSGQKVTITFTPPAGYTPDGYRVYFNTSNNLSGAQLAIDGQSGSPVVISSHLGSTIYEAQAAPVEVFSYDGQTQYEAGADYAVDVEKGLLKRLAGGAIDEAQQLLVVYLYERPAGVVTPLGDAVDLERYRRVKLLQLAADDPEPGSWRESGVEYEFFKVNVSLNDSRWPFSENDFSEGAAVTWDCLYDSAEAKVGTVRSTFGVLAQYE